MLFSFFVCHSCKTIYKLKYICAIGMVVSASLKKTHYLDEL